MKPPQIGFYNVAWHRNTLTFSSRNAARMSRSFWKRLALLAERNSPSFSLAAWLFNLIMHSYGKSWYDDVKSNTFLCTLGYINRSATLVRARNLRRQSPGFCVLMHIYRSIRGSRIRQNRGIASLQIVSIRYNINGHGSDKVSMRISVRCVKTHRSGYQIPPGESIKRNTEL